MKNPHQTKKRQSHLTILSPNMQGFCQKTPQSLQIISKKSTKCLNFSPELFETVQNCAETKQIAVARQNVIKAQIHR